MPDGLLIALIAVAALACPVMMLLGRRGIGPGCRMPGCSPRHEPPESLEQLRERERELASRIEELERAEAVRR